MINCLSVFIMAYKGSKSKISSHKAQFIQVECGSDIYFYSSCEVIVSSQYSVVATDVTAQHSTASNYLSLSLPGRVEHCDPRS